MLQTQMDFHIQSQLMDLTQSQSQSQSASAQKSSRQSLPLRQSSEPLHSLGQLPDQSGLAASSPESSPAPTRESLPESLPPMSSSIAKLSDEELWLRMHRLSRSERKITNLVLSHLQEVEQRKLYLTRGYDSLFAYLTKGLRYSDSAAFRRIQAARLLGVVPEVSRKLESGELNLSQLAQVQTCLRQEAKQGVRIGAPKISRVLESLQAKTKFESEQILAREFGAMPKKMSVVRPQSDESVRLEMTLTREEFEVLKEARVHLSHVVVDGEWGQVLVALAKRYLRSKLGGVTTEKSSSGLSQGDIQDQAQAKVQIKTQFKAQIKDQNKHRHHNSTTQSFSRCGSES